MPPARQRASAGGRPGALVRLVRLSGLSVGVAAALIAVLVAYDVLGRALFRLSNSWVTEVTTYLMGYVTFIGAAYALHERAHVKVDLLIDRISTGRMQRLSIVANAAMLVVVTLLAWLAAEFWWDAWTSGERSPGLLAMPLWMPYLFFFVGMLWLLVVLVALTSGYVRPRDDSSRGG